LIFNQSDRAAHSPHPQLSFFSKKAYQVSIILPELSNFSGEEGGSASLSD
jgi:hypothetical protein